MKFYDHTDIEKKWQDVWKKEEIYTALDKVKEKENFYTLVEFPYPSGNLHVGHWYAFAVTDIFARKKRMEGKNVLFPIGFDAFGLPAENAAIKHNINPREWTYSNMEHMRGQFDLMGGSFDWTREIATCNPEYYKWTQWLFLQFYKNNVAVQKESTVNWCLSCKTVLANEQVKSGHCERCDSEVEQRLMKQWSMKITDYAERLLSGLDTLTWPEEIKQAQRNWIGKSEGSQIDFNLKIEKYPKSDDWKDSDGTSPHIRVFTTRADTLYGVTYVVLSPEHPWVTEALKNSRTIFENSNDIEAYVHESSKKTEIERTSEGKEKTGVKLEGITVINPINNEEIPVYVADYVIASYGTGAVMAVPAHDERDFAFANKYGLAIRRVIAPVGRSALSDTDCFTDYGVLVNSEKYTGLVSNEAQKKITKAASGEIKAMYKLRDWTVSRQRYWGCPIPIIHCEKCGAVPVPDDELPLILPDTADYLPNSEGKSPLAKLDTWVNVKCPSCHGTAKRETDTLDTFVDSSWYFLRYTDSKNNNTFADTKKMDSWMPVNFYTGGAEHTTMHVLYSRFFQKALFDFGLVAHEEPFKYRMNRGLIMGPDGNKMSKSKGNVIDPDAIVAKLGADTVRTYLAFIGPYNEVGSYPWDPDSIVGVRRFIEKLTGLSEKVSRESTSSEEIEHLMHQTIKKVTEDIDSLKMNTAVSQLMIFVNALTKEVAVSQYVFETLLKLAAPFAPHITEELWREVCGHEHSIHIEKWSLYDVSKLQSRVINIAVQINGKTRHVMEFPIDTTQKEIEEQVLASPTIKKWLLGEKIKKIIYIPGKIVSLVI